MRAVRIKRTRRNPPRAIRSISPLQVDRLIHNFALHRAHAFMVLCLLH